MKKIFFILSIALISLGACKKKADETITVPGCMDVNSYTFNSEATEDDGSCQYVEQVNRAAYFHFTEDWCGPCGLYGGPAFDSIVKTIDGTTLTSMKIYRSSNVSQLNNSLGTLMGDASNFNAGGVPTKYVNNTKMSLYGAISANYNQIKSTATTFKGQPVVAGVQLSKAIDGSTMNVTANVQFFKDIAAGKDYRLSIYVLEDNIISKQNVVELGMPSNYVMTYNHRNVWRASSGADYKGEKLNVSAAIASFQIFTKSYSISLLPNWNKAQLKVMAVIWEVPASGIPTVVNSNMVK